MPTPMQIAAELLITSSKDITIANAIQEVPDALINEPVVESGATLLHLLMHSPFFIDFLPLFVRKGANFNTTDATGRTPLDVAMNNHASTLHLKLLLKVGAKPGVNGVMPVLDNAPIVLPTPTPSAPPMPRPTSFIKTVPTLPTLPPEPPRWIPKPAEILPSAPPSPEFDSELVQHLGFPTVDASMPCEHRKGSSAPFIKTNP